MKTSSRPLALAALLLWLMAVLCPLPAAAASTQKVRVTAASVTASANMAGESTVTVQDEDTITADLGCFTMPGAYAEITVTLQNDNTFPVTLVQAQPQDTALPDVSVSFPPLQPGTEVIAPGASCRFTVVVAWAADSTVQYTAASSGTFALKLRYEAEDETVRMETTTASSAGSASSASKTAAADTAAPQRAGLAWLPQTGDTLPLNLLAGLLLASGCVLAVLFHKYRSDRNARQNQTE